MLLFYYNLKTKINTLIRVWFIRLRYPNVILGANLKIYGKLSLTIQKNAMVSIGNNVVFRSNTKYNFVGIYKPVSIAVSENAELYIGNNTGFSGTSIFVAKKLSIGDYCNFGGNTSIWDNDFHPLDYNARRIHDITQIRSNEINIGNDVFISANSIILKGVTIGDRSIVGAGSIVTKDIPPDEIWAGNPAKFIKKIKYINE
jgi:acetyltransferase-like isoleucine patch superfamily enzyme